MTYTAIVGLPNGDSHRFDNVASVTVITLGGSSTTNRRPRNIFPDALNNGDRHLTVFERNASCLLLQATDGEATAVAAVLTAGGSTPQSDDWRGPVVPPPPPPEDLNFSVGIGGDDVDVPVTRRLPPVPETPISVETPTAGFYGDTAPWRAPQKGNTTRG